MFLSIIIPIWNDEKYLEECLDSCLNQDLPQDDYEIICVDDGSTDRTPEILRSYAEQHQNIRVITKQHGWQYGTGRNIGFSNAQGDYLWFVDHDDIVAPNVLRELKTAAEESKDVERIAFPYYVFYDQLSQHEKLCLRKGSLVPNDGDSLLQLALWSGIIKTSFFREQNIWPSSKRVEAAGKFWDIRNFTVWGGDNVCMEECFDKGMRTKQLDGRPIYHYRRNDSAETMRLSQDHLEKKAKLHFHAALLRGYLVAELKKRYVAEREEKGEASKETTIALIMKLRRSVATLNGLSRSLWSEGVRMLLSKDLFFQHKPEEYDFSFWDYLKTRTLKEKISPATYAYYYLYTTSGAKWYRFLTTFSRKRGASTKIIELYRKFKKRLLLMRSRKY